MKTVLGMKLQQLYREVEMELLMYWPFPCYTLFIFVSLVLTKGGMEINDTLREWVSDESNGSSMLVI